MMQEIPVASRTQRRLERRQMLVMTILMGAVVVASFFLGVMVGERGASDRAAELAGPAVAQIIPPPPPAVAATAPRKLTFYEDLPRGNAAPLGSGINLPKGGYVPPPAPVASAPAAPAPPAAVEPAVAKSPEVKQPEVKQPEVKPVSDSPPAKSGGGRFVVQVAATKEQGEAKRLVGKLQEKGFVATSERADLGNKGVWYRVMTGPYGDQATADKVATQLKQQKFAAIVRKL